MSLRQQVLRGGAHLAIRHGLGTAINIVGVVLLTRSIGTTQYGVFAAALGFFTVLHLISHGIEVYLVRREDEISRTTADQAASLLLVAGIGAALVGALSLPLIGGWTRLPGLGRFTLALYAALPLAYLAQVPLAHLERALDYRKLVVVEIVAHTLMFVVAVPLGFAGYGAWAPVAGWWANQIAAFVLYHRLAHYTPRWHWNRVLARDVVAYGAGYTTSIWLMSLRRLVNPLVVGRYLGAEAVAIVAVTTQIASQLGFVAAATVRVSPAAFGRVQLETKKLTTAITDGMVLQILAVGPFMLLFAWFAGLLIAPVLGPAWAPVTRVYPFVALAQLVIAVSTMESSALYVVRRNWDVGMFNAAHTAILAAAAIIMVPKFGLIGYGLAELCTIGGFVLLHYCTVKRIGSPDYRRSLPLLAAFGLGLFWHYIGLWSLAGLVSVAALLRPWREISHLITALRGVLAEA